MPLMIKANCEKKVPEEKVGEFLELGFSLLDENGTVVKEGKPQNKNDFMRENATLKKDLATITKENYALVEENNALKAKVDELTIALAEKITKAATEVDVTAAKDGEETSDESADGRVATKKEKGNK